MTEPILVNQGDGVCRVCQGQLSILDADDATMTVECLECGETYLVEPDAFGDGAMVYYPAILMGETQSSPPQDRPSSDEANPSDE